MSSRVETASFKDRPRRNQILGIVQPDVGAMGETGNADQFRKGLGLGVDEHLADERRAKFRDAQAADFRAQLFRRHAQGLGRTEQAQGGRVIKGNGRRLDAGHIFEHTDDRRIIMAEDVELDQTAFDGVIIEMGRNDAAVLLVGRVLDRREMMDVHVAGNDHDAARMLARRILDARAAGDEAVDVSVVDLDTLGVGPLHDVAISRLILDAPMVPARKTLSLPNSSSVYLWAFGWYSPEKLRSISGTLSPSKPRKIANGMLWPFLWSGVPQWGQTLSGKSKPPPTSPWVKNSLHWHLGQT